METVAKFFKEEKDPFYIRGIEKGKIEGKILGERKGELKGKAEVIRNLLQTGKFSVEEVAVLANVPVEFVSKIHDSHEPESF